MQADQRSIRLSLTHSPSLSISLVPCWKHERVQDRGEVDDDQTMVSLSLSLSISGQSSRDPGIDQMSSVQLLFVCGNMRNWSGRRTRRYVPFPPPSILEFTDTSVNRDVDRDADTE